MRRRRTEEFNIFITYFHCVNLEDVTATITEMDITTRNSDEPDDDAAWLVIDWLSVLLLFWNRLRGCCCCWGVAVVQDRIWKLSVTYLVELVSDFFAFARTILAQINIINNFWILFFKSTFTLPGYVAIVCVGDVWTSVSEFR